MLSIIKFLVAILYITAMFALVTNPYTLAIGVLIGPPAFKFMMWLMKSAANIIKSLGF